MIQTTLTMIVIILIGLLMGLHYAKGIIKQAALLEKVVSIILAIVGTLWMMVYSYQYTTSTQDAVFVSVFFFFGIGLTILAQWIIKQSKYSIWLMPIYGIILLVISYESGLRLTSEMNIYGVFIAFLIGTIIQYVKVFSVDKGMHLLGSIILTVALGWVCIQAYDIPYKFINKVVQDTREYLQEEGYALSEDDTCMFTEEQLVDDRYTYSVHYFRLEQQQVQQVIYLTYNKGDVTLIQVSDIEPVSQQVD